MASSNAGARRIRSLKREAAVRQVNQWGRRMSHALGTDLEMDLASIGTDSCDTHVLCPRTARPFPILQLCVRSAGIAGWLFPNSSATCRQRNGFLGAKAALARYARPDPVA